MTGLDWTVLAVYFCGILGVAAYAGRRNKGMEDFFLAGREMPWWAVGLSVMATQISAITFISTTGQAYVDGMRFLVVYFGLPIAMVVLCGTLLPFYFRTRVSTAYEFLEQRFDGKTRTLTSLLFLASRGLSMGVTLYAPSVVLASVLGWDESRTILVMGGTTVLYVLHGGNRSVIWTDVVQMAVVWLGIFTCLWVAVSSLPPTLHVGGALALAQTAGRLNVIDTSTRVSTPYTVWEGLIAGTFLALSYFGCDQSQVQRYLSSRSLRESRLSLLFNAVLKVPMQFVILLTGVFVFVFYHFHAVPLLWNPAQMKQLEQRAWPPQLAHMHAEMAQAHELRRHAAEAIVSAPAELREDAVLAYREAERRMRAARRGPEYLAAAGGAYNDTNYIFPWYVLHHLPRGMTGLVIAVIFAAAMSTLSGELSALASASMLDLYKRWVVSPPAGDLWRSRVFTALWGVFACGVALKAGQLGSAIEVVNRFGSFFYGSILGVFALGVLTRRATARGAFLGLFAGMATVAAVSTFTSVHFLWYNVVGAAVVFATGLLFSLAVPGPASGTGVAPLVP
jgi:SSS family transporter